MDLNLFVNILIPVAGVLGLVVVAVLYQWLQRQDAGTERMKEVAHFIQIGANAFLRREFITIAPFVIVLAVVLFLVMPEGNWQTALGFVLGAAFSLLATYVGMNAAVRANVRTTQAARSSIGKALTIAFRGGGIMGLTIDPLTLLGVVILVWIFSIGPDNVHDVNLLVGFGFGASLAALFAQLGGGIYTKSADVGADLVGKVEVGIPEDDPRNAAVIADLVGDNVGDCAGRGADLFESGIDNVITAMIVGAAPVIFQKYGWHGVLFPLTARAVGVLATIMGVFLARGRDDKNPIRSVNTGFLTSAAICLAGFYVIARWLMDDTRLFLAQVFGMVGVFVLVFVVQHYTGIHGKPVHKTAQSAKGGPALNILEGLAYGMESSVWGLFILGAVILVAYIIGGGGLLGIFYISAATIGIAELKGIIMTGDTFGPIVDNAAGISEMAGLEQETRTASDALDAVGNVTKAITKGYAMGVATMSSLVILFAYLLEVARLEGIHLTGIDDFLVNLANPTNAVGIFFGAVMPYLFSALTLRSVNDGAHLVMEEVRRQFREIRGLMEGEAQPEYAHCVDLTTSNALQKMIAPTFLSVVIPVVIGFVLGPWALTAYLISVTASSAALASTQFNAGGALDNAKKLIEEGEFGGKGSDAHAAAVSGDTFGDPMKDTAGPSLHILIKLQNIMSITLLPLYVRYGLNLFQ